MNYQDNKRVQTAEELRRMYNLDNLSKDRQAIANNKSGLTRIEAEQSNILKSLIINLGDSIEDQSEISLWFFNGIPTLSNVPVIEWEDKSEHIGDFYYDKDTGCAYKFILEEDTYLWEQQSDSNLIQALALTNAELDTVDGSRKVFFTTPTTPYDNGDWYVDENSDLYICQISKPLTEQYNPNDFIIASKYTDDTKAMEVAGKLTIVSGQVTTIIKNLDIISQTIEDNRYYIDETGNKILITEKMSQVVQTVNKLESEISEAADITISADGYGNVSLANINESEPVYLKIHPTNNNDISFLYPSDNLYPGDDIFMSGRTIRFATDNYYVDYELPDDLLYYDENNYDEFILDYGGQSCVVNKRVGYNADGSKYLLDSPQTLVYEYPTIHLNTGDYTVTMLGYEDAYIFARMMVQSLYTDQFATKMEMNSAITQTAKSIDLSINQKLSNYSTTSEMNSAISLKANEITSSVSNTYATKTETATAKQEAINSANVSTDKKLKNYSTTTQMKSEIKQTADAINLEVSKKVDGEDVVSTINQSAEQITIKGNRLVVEADNFELDKNGNMICTNATVSGKITTTEGTIGGWTINEDGLTNGTVTINKNGITNIYTPGDLAVVMSHIMGYFTLSGKTLEHYDFNGDGIVNSQDYVILYRMIEDSF